MFFSKSCLCNDDVQHLFRIQLSALRSLKSAGISHINHVEIIRLNHAALKVIFERKVYFLKDFPMNVWGFLHERRQRRAGMSHWNSLKLYYVFLSSTALSLNFLVLFFFAKSKEALTLRPFPSCSTQLLFPPLTFWKCAFMASFHVTNGT